MFDKEKRKGVPARSQWYVIAAIVIGVVGLVATLGFFMLKDCWFTVGCNSLPPTPFATMRPTLTATYIPTYVLTSTPPPALRPTLVPSPPLTAMSSAQESLYEPYELRAFAINDGQSTIAFSYWDGANGVLETRPWLDRQIGDSPANTVVRTPRTYERIGFYPNRSILMAWQEQDYNGEVTLFDLQKSTIAPIFDSVHSPDGRWYAQAASGQLIVYDEQKPVAHLMLEGIYDSVAFSPLGDSLAVVSRDGDSSFYVEVFDLTTKTIERTHRRLYEGNLTSPVVYHPKGTSVAVASDSEIYLIPLNGEPEFTTSLFAPSPIRFLAFNPWSEILAGAGGDPEKGEYSGVYLIRLNERDIRHYGSRAHFIPIDDEIIGLQEASGLVVGTRRQIGYIRSGSAGWEGWSVKPILTSSNDGITLINQ